MQLSFSTGNTQFGLSFAGVKNICDDEELILPGQKWKRVVWLAFEFPETSTAARVIAGLSVSTILLSVTTLCLETLPQYKNYRLNYVHSVKDADNVTTEFTAVVEQDPVPLVDGVSTYFC